MDKHSEHLFRQYLFENEDRLAAELGARARLRPGHVPTLGKAAGGSAYSRTWFKQAAFTVCAGSAHALRVGCAQRMMPLADGIDQALFLWATRPLNVHPSAVVESYLGDSPLALAPDVLVSQVHPAAWGPFIERVRREGQQKKAAARAAFILWATTARSQSEQAFLRHRLEWERNLEFGKGGAASPAPVATLDSPPAGTSGQNPALQAPPVDIL